MRYLMIAATLAGVSLPAVAAAQPALSPVANPALWPKVAARPVRDAKVEARIDALLAKMSIEDKVGQLLQVDIGSLTPADLLTYKLGSVLNGGNSDPNSDPLAAPVEWLKLADKFYDASMTRSDGRPQVPVIWGTDAVHGNNNIFGATLFPHNIGLGAARDPALVREIARVTALETAAAGLDWTFAPTLAVVQDDRWGRTYESYSEEPALLADYAAATIEGLQGKVGTPEFLSSSHVLATTKHFLGDGGTGGRDQGDTRLSEADFRDVHLGGYPAAIAAGTQSVMASFSSWNGVKMSGNKSLLTDVLKDRMGFDGFVVGDWNSHGQVPGCTNEDCAAAINAGMDMFMYSGPDWKKLYANTLAQSKAGTIPQARLDDAVRRILRAKIRAGLFEKGRPSSRPLAGKFELINAPAHREIARQAVRASLVLLKNERRTLPLRPNAEILVAGGGADKINQQAGGWSLSWQGDDMPNSAFPNAHSIWTGIRDTVAAAGGRATLTPDGSFTKKPAAAIVVFGEQPYAEFKGDRPTLEYSPGDRSDLALLKKLKAAGIPVVAVFLSGRPLWVNAELNASDAFVAAFLPGSEGAAVADVLFTKADGSVRHDFRGKLSFSWPKRPDQFVLNRRDKPYDPLFAYGYGLSYARAGTVARLDETRPAGLPVDAGGLLFVKGAIPEGWRLTVAEAGGTATPLTAATGGSTGGKLTVAAIDRAGQEDSRRLTWTGPGEVRLVPPAPVDLTRETNGEISLTIEYRVDSAPAAPVEVAMADASGKVASIVVETTLAASKTGEWSTLSIPLQCFAKQGLDMAKVAAPLVLKSSGAATLSVSAIRQVYVNVPMTACAR